MPAAWKAMVREGYAASSGYVLPWLVAGGMCALCRRHSVVLDYVNIVHLPEAPKSLTSNSNEGVRTRNDVEFSPTGPPWGNFEANPQEPYRCALG